MTRCAGEALHMALTTFENYSPELAESIRENESRCDRYEDELGTYLVRLSAQQLSDAESEEATELLKIIGDFERISDHAVNLLAASEELRSKGLGFSATAEKELKVLIGAVSEILNTAERAFSEKDLAAAAQVEPLKQVIVALKEQMRTRHILRMQQGHCSIEAGFVWSDLLTDLERTADHCSNIAGCVLDAANHGLNLHERCAPCVPTTPTSAAPTAPTRKNTACRQHNYIINQVKKRQFAFVMYPQYRTPGIGANRFRLYLFVFDEVAENADLEVVTE